MHCHTTFLQSYNLLYIPACPLRVLQPPISSSLYKEDSDIVHKKLLFHETIPRQLKRK